MKLTLARQDLARALGQIARVVERRNTIPILAHLLLRTEAGEGLRIIGTDLDIEVSTVVPAAVAIAGELTLPAAILDAYIRKLPDGADVLIEAAPALGGSVVAIRSGRTRATLLALAAGDFPNLAAGDMPVRFALPGRDLDRLLGAVQLAISTEETRYYLNGIYLHVAERDGAPHLRAVATDGHRLGRADLAAPAGADGMEGVIVPRKAVAEIRRLCEGMGEGEVTVEVSPAKIRVSAGPTVLTSKLIDGTFPDYARVIPAGNARIATLALRDLAAAIERVATVSSERGRAIKLDFAPDGPLRLAMNNPDSGSATDDVDCDFASAEPLSIGFNARYAGDILAALGSASVEIALDLPGSPSTWRVPGDVARLYVLMPMRV